MPARRRTRVASVRLAGGEHVGEAARQQRAAGRQEALDLAVHGVPGVEAGDGVGHRAEPLGELGGQVLGVVEVAGGEVLVGHLGHHLLDGAAQQPAPGELVDADR